MANPKSDEPQGTLHPALHRLENRKLLSAEWKMTDCPREGDEVVERFREEGESR